MPYTKVQISHHFGIISQKQKAELQKRLIENNKKTPAKTGPSNLKSPLDVLAKFCSSYRSAQNQTERDNLDQKAKIMLSRTKIRIGLGTPGRGILDLELGWTELGVLAHCGGLIKRECVDMLLRSLESATFKRSDAEHIAVLYYVAECTLFWLRLRLEPESITHREQGTSGPSSRRLDPSDLQILTIAQLVLLRLHCIGRMHPMDSMTAATADRKRSLRAYLEGFEKRAGAESPLSGSVTAMDHLARLQQLGRYVLDDEVSPNDEAAAAPDEPRNARRPNAALDAVLAIWRLLQSQKGYSPIAEAHQLLLSGAPSLREHSWLDSVLALCVLGELCTSQLSLLATCMQLAGQSVGAGRFEVELWPSPVGLAFARDLLLVAATLGRTSEIRRLALIGISTPDAKQRRLAGTFDASLISLLSFTGDSSEEDNCTLTDRWLLRHVAYYSLQVVQSFVRALASSSDGRGGSGGAEFDVRLEWCARAVELAQREERDLRVLNAPACPEFDARRLLAIALPTSSTSSTLSTSTGNTSREVREVKTRTVANEFAEALAAAFAPDTRTTPESSQQVLKVPFTSPQRHPTLNNCQTPNTTSVHFAEIRQRNEAAEAAPTPPSFSKLRGDTFDVAMAKKEGTAAKAAAGATSSVSIKSVRVDRRNLTELRRVVEDQWRKEMHSQFVVGEPSVPHLKQREEESLW